MIPTFVPAKAAILLYSISCIMLTHKDTMDKRARAHTHANTHTHRSVIRSPTDPPDIPTSLPPRRPRALRPDWPPLVALLACPQQHSPRLEEGLPVPRRHPPPRRSPPRRPPPRRPPGHPPTSCLTPLRSALRRIQLPLPLSRPRWHPPMRSVLRPALRPQQVRPVEAARLLLPPQVRPVLPLGLPPVAQPTTPGRSKQARHSKPFRRAFLQTLEVQRAKQLERRPQLSTQGAPWAVKCPRAGLASWRGARCHVLHARSGLGTPFRAPLSREAGAWWSKLCLCEPGSSALASRGMPSEPHAQRSPLLQ